MDYFIETVNKIVDKQIIISTEMFLRGHIDYSESKIKEIIHKDPTYFYQGVPLNNYWEYYNINQLPIRKYVNSGLIIGKCKNIKNALKWIIDNKFTDDQLGFSIYTNTFPQLVHLDFNANVIHTSCGYINGCLYDYNIQKNDIPSFNELFGFSSYFIHLPGLSSKGQKYIYDIICMLFDNNKLDKTMFNLYNIKQEFIIRNDYFIK